MTVRGSRSPALDWVRTCLGVDARPDGGINRVRAQRVSRGVATEPVSGESAIAAAGSAGIPVAACLGARECVTRWVEAPFTSRSKAERVFPTLLDVELPFPIEDCIYSFLDPHVTQDGKTRALAVVARAEAVRSRIEELAALGAEPVVLDHEGLALWTQSLQEKPPQAAVAGKTRVVVNIRQERWTVVVGLGERFLNCHSVKAGDYAQVRRLILTASPGAEPAIQAQWFLAGSQAADPAFESQFRTELSQQGAASAIIHDDPGLFLARSVATRALTAGDLRCNMRAGVLTHPLILARRDSQLLKAGIAALAAGLILCAAGAFAAVSARSAELAGKRAFSETIRRLDVNVGGALGEQAISIAHRGAAARLDPLRPFLSPFDPSLADLVAGLGDLAAKKGLAIESVTLTKDRVQLTGKTKSWDSCEALAAYFQKNGYAVKSDRKENLADETVVFSINSIAGK